MGWARNNKRKVEDHTEGQEAAVCMMVDGCDRGLCRHGSGHRDHPVPGHEQHGQKAVGGATRERDQGWDPRKPTNYRRQLML